eukprot:g20664.t1
MAEQVYKLKHKLSGPQIRSVAAWAFYSRILHILAMAAQIWDRKTWKKSMYFMSCGLLTFIGFSSRQIHMLLNDNGIQKEDIYKVVFSSDLMNLLDPMLMGTKLMRSAAAKWVALTGDTSVGLAAAITKSIPIKHDDPYIQEDDRTELRDIADADAALERKFSAAKQTQTSAPPPNRINSSPLWVPTLSKSDFCGEVLRKTHGGDLVYNHDGALFPLKFDKSITILLLRDPATGGTAAILDNETISRAKSDDFYDHPAIKVADELRFASTILKAIIDISTMPMLYQPNRPPVVFWVCGLDLHLVRNSGIFLTLWRAAALSHFPIYWLRSSPDKEIAPINMHRPVFCHTTHFVEVAERDDRIKWPKRTTKTRFCLDDWTEPLRRKESQQAVDECYPLTIEPKTKKQKVTT